MKSTKRDGATTTTTNSRKDKDKSKILMAKAAQPPLEAEAGQLQVAMSENRLSQKNRD